MSQLNRQTPAGRAYLDLQNRARRDRRGTQGLLTLYVVERWLARLSASPYAEDFVLKGGMLPPPTTRAARLPMSMRSPRGLVNDQDTVVARITDVADRPPTKCRVPHRHGSRGADPGGRVLPGRPGGDGQPHRDRHRPVPARRELRRPCHARAADDRAAVIRPDAARVRVLGYPIGTVLAEKLATAITARRGQHARS
jgi:hypothetical protein